MSKDSPSQQMDRLHASSHKAPAAPPPPLVELPPVDQLPRYLQHEKDLLAAKYDVEVELEAKKLALQSEHLANERKKDATHVLALEAAKLTQEKNIREGWAKKGEMATAATSNEADTKPATEDAAPGYLSKALGWVKENPWKVGGIVAGTVGVVGAGTAGAYYLGYLGGNAEGETDVTGVGTPELKVVNGGR